jgi:hypothetical protein
VPFLVLLPLVEGDQLVGQPGQSTMTLLTSLGPTVLQTLLGLGVLLVGGRVVLRRIFEMVRPRVALPCQPRGSLYSNDDQGPMFVLAWAGCSPGPGGLHATFKR